MIISNTGEAIFIMVIIGILTCFRLSMLCKIKIDYTRWKQKVALELNCPLISL